ncbi:HAMP domain-containing protein [Shewanella sp. JM162201]|uniref:histidine kinase n=1 Tax=Shewanella jiangmenensis TaxID=2837387 RepID=A0ABS5V5L6_9GAMM|nr:ATP-binding protein [Shewanella jiangmenensis]MBT1445253.1 HAMP domain-containing protein [Shewanella jiangmenensis]
MNTTSLPNRLFIKLLLGFWLCSSLVLVAVGSLPLLQKRQEQAAVPPELITVLSTAADAIVKDPKLLEPEHLRRFERARQSDRPMRLFIANDDGRILGGRAPRTLRKFILLAEEAERPILQQFEDEAVFGPYKFRVGHEEYRIYGRLPGHHPRPLFLFFIEHKLLTLGLAVLVSGLLCGLLAWHLGRPLKMLKQSADALARGHLGSRVDAATLNRRDELGQLGHAFNAMAEAIELQVNNQQRLMGDISHELRTPLTRLQLALALARKRGQDSNELSRIAHEAGQLDALIAELLTLSRVTMGATEARIDCELAESLGQVLDDAEFEASQCGKHLTIEMDDHLRLSHSPKLLARAVENLLRNAIRYANSALSLKVADTPDSVEIRICDDGPGVDEAELEAIFRPFYRTDKSRERESGGWGLGLAITAAAIETQGGSISASNQTGGGLCVTICLPRE